MTCAYPFQTNELPFAFNFIFVCQVLDTVILVRSIGMCYLGVCALVSIALVGRFKNLSAAVDFVDFVTNATWQVNATIKMAIK